MANENRKFIVKDGDTTLFEGFEYIANKEDAVYLTELTGWDEVSVEINSEPALSRAGSYLVSTHLGESEITATFNLWTANNVAVWLYAVKKTMLTFNPVTLTRTYSNDAGVELRKEVNTAYITSVSGWEQKDNDSDITIVFKCLNPIKTVYLNGSTTPVTGGGL